MEYEKEVSGRVYEHVLALLSGLRKIPAQSEEDKAYNNALGDTYDSILEAEEKVLLQHTVWCGKWKRD